MHKVCHELTDFHHLRKKFDLETAKIKYVFQRFIKPQETSRHANRFSFIYELHRGRHLEVTDPRDRVFAMIGHYSVQYGTDRELQALQADYNKTVEQVYTDVAARALKGDRESLITLAAVQHMTLPSNKTRTANSEPCPNNLRLPSWVPDWRTYQSHILSEPTSPHRASGAKTPDLHVNESSQILSVRGILIDTIDACSDGLKPKSFHAGNGYNHHEAPAVERLWRDICGHHSFNLTERYVNGDSAALAYTQTLSSGCVAIWWAWDAENRLPYDQVPEREWLAHGAAYLTKTVGPDTDVSQELWDVVAEQGPGKWSQAANGASSNRAFARTAKGYYVLGPKVMEVGDVVCVLFGGKMPFCLRPWGEGQYLLVGECYVHGLMKGEAELLRLGKEEGVFELI